MRINGTIYRSLAVRVVVGTAALLAFLMIGCEDAPPNDYMPQYVVEGFLIVDQPIDHIVISRSQSITDTFKVARGIVTDAQVSIIDGDRTLALKYRGGDGGNGEYYDPDTNEVVKINTLYKLLIRTKEGGTITAQTLTPARFAWTAPPRDTVSIPKSTDPAYLKPPDSLDLAWTATAGVEENLISVRSLDTAEYGRYLNPPTDVKNRRINPDLDKLDNLHDADVARWGFVARTRTPIVWGAFKWFGRQEVTVFAADPSFVNWFKMTNWTGNPQYDPLQGNVRGDGIGVFGSAAVIKKDVFVRM